MQAGVIPVSKGMQMIALSAGQLVKGFTASTTELYDWLQVLPS